MSEQCKVRHIFASTSLNCKNCGVHVANAYEAEVDKRLELESVIKAFKPANVVVRKVINIKAIKCNNGCCNARVS